MPAFCPQAKKMVEEQIRRRGIRNPVLLDVMSQIPRHEFLPEDRLELAYIDGPVDIGFGQTISQPYIVAYMSELLQLEGKEKVLEIGTGSGYQTAVLARLASHVYSVELIPELSIRAETVLKRLGFKNVTLRIGDGKIGWPEEALFDRILITAAARKLPEELLKQLTIGGIIVWPEGDLIQYIYRLQKKDDSICKEQLLPVSFVPLR